ncbi:carbohydrate binding domain-containing protein, partial [Proteiniclasticum sp. BAD-10]
LDLTLTVNGGSAEPFVLTDKGGNRLIFNSAGKLTHLKDLENNTLQVQYSAEGRIQSVTDGSGRTALLGFSEGRLQEITDPAGRKLRFGYRGAQLVSITYPDGKVTTYDYDGEMKLRSAVRPDGYRMEWTYYGIAPYRVRTMAETGAAGALGGSLTLTYGYNTTTLTDRAGRSQTLQFNAQGNPVSLRDEGGYGAYFGYGTSGGTRNKLTLESKVQRTVLNTLQNPSGESTSAWQIVQHNGSQGTLVADSLAKTSGNSSLRITKTGAGGTVFAEQEVTLTRGKTYTLSAKLKTDSISAGNAMGALVAVRYTDGHGWKYAYGRYVSGTKDWARVEVTFTLESPALSPQVVACVGIEGESGTAWFDELQLEEG